MTTFATPVEQTLASFDWQWDNLPSGDFMPGDAWFDANATRLLSTELCAIAPEWFRGKRVLDAGCGRGRWSRALLDLGAQVTAIDFSEAGLARTRELCGDTDRLVTRRVNLLEIPEDLARDRFDLVFSFGVLHHTGDTWRALGNVMPLAGDAGAMFLYLYGATAWSAEESARIESLRRELAELPFDEKIRELSRRFPGDDPHQLFDLIGPVINDRVRIEEVQRRLTAAAFSEAAQTVAAAEVYVRATREGFPRGAMLQPVGAASEFSNEAQRRGLVRRGVAAEEGFRAAVSDVPRREATAAWRDAIGEVGTQLIDLSFAPDCLGDEADLWSGPALSTPGLVAQSSANIVAWSGATLGACRFPLDALRGAWAHVAEGGRLLVEIATGSFGAERSIVDRARGYGKGVPEKLAMLLRAHGEWSSGEALFALGGAALLNPLPASEAATELRALGASEVKVLPCRPGTILLEATRGAARH